MSLTEIETPDTQPSHVNQPRYGAGVSPHADPDAQDAIVLQVNPGAGPAISFTPPETRRSPNNDLNRVAGGVASTPTTGHEALAEPIENAALAVGLAGGAAAAKSLPEGVSPLTPAASSCPPPDLGTESKEGSADGLACSSADTTPADTMKPSERAVWVSADSSCPPPIVYAHTNQGSAVGHNLVEGLAVYATTPPAFSPVPPVLEGGAAIEGEIPDNYTPFTLELDLLTLRMWAATYDAASRNKMATDARFRELTNLQQHLPGADVQQKFAKQQKAHARKMLFAAYQRAFPTIHGWAVNVPGLATSSDLAWLLALTGDPRVKQPYIRLADEPAGHVCCEKCGPGKHLVALEETPRKVSELWSYCGHGAAIRRRKGMTAAEALAGGNTMAKTLAHRLAEACMKMPGGVTSTGKARKRSPYRDVYDTARAKVEGREDWSDGHKHNHAVRLTAKAILKDLWLVQHGLTPTYGATQ